MKRWFFENLGLKALALLIAVALWANVDLRQVLDHRKMTVHLDFTDIPAGMGLDPGTKNSVSLLLIGSKEKVQDMDPDDLDAVVSLKGYAPGQEEMVVRPKVPSLPDGVTASVKEIKVRLRSLEDPRETPKKRRSRR